MVTARAAGELPDAHVLDLQQAGPTVSRMLVGAQLRRLREARGITREDAGYVIRASESKISRLELGRIGFKQRDVGDLLSLYGVRDDGERATLLALAEQANTPGWWQPYKDVLPCWFEAYLGLEGAAHVIRVYEVQFVPGLLQTPEYARAVIRQGHERAHDDEIERRVRLRMDRQRVLRGPQAPKLWAVLDEAVLRRPFGCPETMRAQVRHLMEATELGHVTLQVIPFRSGGHAAECGSFTILRLPQQTLPDVVYLEQLTGALYLDKPSDVEHYWHVMNVLGIKAEPPTATAAVLHRILKEM
ncbi:helix-turn-helix domain-containing protein [Wenjunlia tyrosinilytica]|uniref:Transcriptional regulator n=1 Tax=Wenjunlia tyrosinilytica TaxID=1544741 RepID=A0A918DZI8_9ACTN|nr:helix-turn-helix transcriptional regulator [Wenjunlia tyrosinilytica]GGO94051.1 transcriptional regulator [Wenjunlia tyrosinilytica]